MTSRPASLPTAACPETALTRLESECAELRQQLRRWSEAHDELADEVQLRRELDIARQALAKAVGYARTMMPQTAANAELQAILHAGGGSQAPGCAHCGHPHRGGAARAGASR